ncbi:hypothetical protein AB1Y20_001058 [Prymnesium parvum]|uniref:Uncharacterized protein n=1 Tax=Prymnesium parvum TaxID=97485 RepID=A0AB34K9Z6_PRYPA|mmetsp:Transcript_7014/g.17542  ORF Transcript_7014/g.17542 Transcript_7014/m.17542 type:complete len:341 (+) Transcript_7014:135-1157(+)
MVLGLSRVAPAQLTSAPATPRPSGYSDADWLLYLNTLRVVALQHSTDEMDTLTPRQLPSIDRASRQYSLPTASDADQLLAASTMRLAQRLTLNLGHEALGNCLSMSALSPTATTPSTSYANDSVSAPASARWPPDDEDSNGSSPLVEPHFTNDMDRLLWASTQRIMKIRQSRYAQGDEESAPTASKMPNRNILRSATAPQVDFATAQGSNRAKRFWQAIGSAAGNIGGLQYLVSPRGAHPQLAVVCTPNHRYDGNVSDVPADELAPTDEVIPTLPDETVELPLASSSQNDVEMHQTNVRLRPSPISRSKQYRVADSPPSVPPASAVSESSRRSPSPRRAW